MKFEYTKSKRGGVIIYHEQFIYNKDSQNNNGETRFRCRNRNCLGILVLTADEIVLKTTPHNHATEDAEIKKRKLCDSLILKATDSRNSFKDILYDATKKCEDSVLEVFPKTKSLNDLFSKKRRENGKFVPKNIEEIPNFIKFDDDGDLFVRFDNGFENINRFVVLGSKFKENLIENIEVFIIDGTFKIVPYGYTQLITLHGEFLGSFSPFIYILMNNKEESSYIQAFSKCATIFNFKPKLIITDLEKGLINAVKKCFPNSIQKLCNFHMNQAIWRKIQGYGYAKLYKTDNVFNFLIRKIMTLAFLKNDDIDCMFSNICCELKKLKYEKIEEFINYLERNYFGVQDGSKYINSLYERKMWNLNECVINSWPRTSNNVEAWHRSINATIHIKHPNIALLIEKLLIDEKIYKIKTLRAFAGNFEFREINLLKENKLKIIIKNYNYLTKDAILLAIMKLFMWEFDD